MEYCVEKLRRYFPDLDTAYRTGLAYLKGKVAYWKARAAMARGDGAAARALLGPFRRNSWQFCVLYTLTYLGPAIWHRVHQLRLRTGLFA